MRMVAAALTMAVLSGCLAASDKAAQHPLIGRKVEYASLSDGRPDVQYWYDDGTTLFITDNWLLPAFRDRKRARWWLSGDEYCRSFTAYEQDITDKDKAEHLVCYRMQVIEDEAGIRFTRLGTALERPVWTGRYLK